MIIRIVMYAVRCDFPECEKQDSTDDYVAWLTPQQAHEVATTDGGWFSPTDERSGEKHYCPDHLAWCEECDEQMAMVDMVQDPEDRSWTCKSHATEEVSNGV